MVDFNYINVVDVDLNINYIFLNEWLFLIFGFSLCILCPNSIEIMTRVEPSITKINARLIKLKIILWRPTTIWGFVTGALLFLSTISILLIDNSKKFIYFNF
jgi:hypothetical protein